MPTNSTISCDLGGPFSENYGERFIILPLSLFSLLKLTLSLYVRFFHDATPKVEDDLLQIYPSFYVGAQLISSLSVSFYAMYQSSMDIAADETYVYKDDDDDGKDPDHLFSETANRLVGRSFRVIWLSCCMTNGASNIALKLHVIWRLLLPRRKGALQLLIQTSRLEARSRVIRSKQLLLFIFVATVALLSPLVARPPDDHSYYRAIAWAFVVYLGLQLFGIALLLRLWHLTYTILDSNRHVTRKFLLWSAASTVAFIWLFTAVAVQGRDGVMTSLDQNEDSKRYKREALCHQFWYNEVILLPLLCLNMANDYIFSPLQTRLLGYALRRAASCLIAAADYLDGGSSSPRSSSSPPSYLSPAEQQWRDQRRVRFNQNNNDAAATPHTRYLQLAMEEAARWSYDDNQGGDASSSSNKVLAGGENGRGDGDGRGTDATAEVERRMERTRGADISVIPPWLLEFGVESGPIGAGGEGMVFQGRYAGRDVAVKLAFAQLQEVENADSDFNHVSWGGVGRRGYCDSRSIIRNNYSSLILIGSTNQPTNQPTRRFACCTR